jgi:hypothetical protein
VSMFSVKTERKMILFNMIGLGYFRLREIHKQRYGLVKQAFILNIV